MAETVETDESIRTTLRQKMAASKRLENPLLRQIVAASRSQYVGMGGHKKPLAIGETWRERLARNVQLHMRARPDLDTSEKLARKAFWTDGRRKGKRIGARTIRYLLDPRPDSPSPALDLIVAIAEALAVEPFELLVDTELTRRHILERVLDVHPEEASSKRPSGPAADGRTAHRR